MACTAPLTRSLGYAFLIYRTHAFQIPHTSRVRLTAPIDPSDIATIRPAVETWAELTADLMTAQSVVTDWGTMNQDGSIFYSEAFPTPYLGTHGVSVGATALRSRTLTLTGKGVPVAGGQCAGQTRQVIFVSDAFEWAPGQKTIAAVSDAAIEALRDFLTGNSILGADYYGNVGNWRANATVQYNAYIQRKLGT